MIMKINILLPYKEKFDKNLASSVSITIKNNLKTSIFKKSVTVFGRNVLNPISKANFIGIKDHWNPFVSKNKFLAKQMVKYI